MNGWSDFRDASTEQILEWAADEPWARAMARCEQDARWHSEGDVWTHTRLVVKQLERLPEWPALPRDTQLTLLFTALFHDAGKPATTRVDPETGRTHAPKHAIVGMELCRLVLRELGCGLHQREEIANLVRYHGRPPFLLEKPDPEKELIALSWLVHPRLLYLFALADTRGRNTTDTARPEENLHLWKMVAEEVGCFDRPYKFANDQARFLFYRDALSSLHYTPREDYRATVTLMSGLPGAGKDTWLSQRRPELPVVSLDDVRAHMGIEAVDNQGPVIQAAREQCREHLRAGRDFAFNGTNISVPIRRRWIDLFADYGARVEVIYLEPALPVVFEQNARRPEPVPRQVIERLVEKLEPPTITEAHAVTLIG